MDALVAGSGAMGQWTARVISEALSDGISLFFYDTDCETAIEAANRLGGEAITTFDAGRAFDIVCIAVPMSAATDAIATHAPRAGDAIFDVTGSMAEPLEAMEAHASDCERASLHPLFAPANEPGNIPIVVSRAGPVVDSLRSTLTDRGNEVFETTATEHDRMMETVQSSTHAALLAFALAGDSVPDQFHTPISTELTELARQVTAGNPRVYREIQETFEGVEDVAEAADQIATADGAAFEQLYNRASEELDTSLEE